MPRTHAIDHELPPAHCTMTALRLKPDEHAKILRVVHQGLALEERLSVSDVLRIALLAFDVRTLSRAQVMALRSKDGRVLRRKKQPSRR